MKQWLPWIIIDAIAVLVGWFLGRAVGKYINKRRLQKEDPQILRQGDGKPWLNDKGQTIPEKCPICGADVGLFLCGEPVFLCTQNDKHYFGTLMPPDNLTFEVNQ